MKKNLTVQQRSTSLRNWIKQRDLFNISAICRRVDYDRGAFSHWLEGHKSWDLGEETIIKLENALVDYGYKFKP